MRIGYQPTRYPKGYSRKVCSHCFMLAAEREDSEIYAGFLDKIETGIHIRGSLYDEKRVVVNAYLCEQCIYHFQKHYDLYISQRKKG
jgi:hypothetical protein